MDLCSVAESSLMTRCNVQHDNEENDFIKKENSHQILKIHSGKMFNRPLSMTSDLEFDK